MFQCKLGLKTKFSILFYLLSLGAMLIIGWYGYQNAQSAYKKAALDLANGQAAEVSVHIKDFLQLSYSDLDFIANNYAIQRHSYWEDIGEQEKAAQYHQIVVDTLRGFAVANRYDFKIRVLSSNGREHIVVRRDPVTGEVRVLPDSELQDQHKRDFFTQTLQLPRGQIFASILDLNTEHGKVMQPYLPVVRFATPLIGDNDVRYGVVVVNLLAEHFFKYIREASNNPQQRVFYLVAADGEYLFHPDLSKCFAKQLGHQSNFEQDYPAVLAKIKRQKDQGFFWQADNLIVYHKIYPVANNRQSYWLLIGVAPESFALAELERFEVTFAILVIIVMLFVLLSTRFFLTNLMRPLAFVTRQLQMLGRGEVKVEDLNYSYQDELKTMLVSTQALVVNMEQLAQQADAVGKGDFSGRVRVFSAQDRLGTALNNMTALLQAAKQDEQNRSWLHSGLEQLSKALIGDLSPQQLAEVSISLISRYLAAGRGVFYEYHSDNQVLELLGSYMYSERNLLGNHFKLGEGAVGQVAREKKPIRLTALSQEQPLIITGTHASLPLYTFTYPLLHENDLLGVIELASFVEFDEVQLMFLQEATNTVASFLYMTGQSEQIKKLLAISEAATKEARDNSSRLQAANLQMEEQQQQLQQQTEELQQSNGQMEEQQQKLEQQTYELQHSNAQMEEQQQQLELQNRSLMQAQQELDARSKQLELSSQYKSEFLANMSHELRTPLNSIILLSKMMIGNSEKNLSDEEIRHAKVIHSAGQELLRLINDVLDLSKIESGRMELHLGTVSSQDLLTELKALFEQTAKEKHLDFNLQDDLQSEFVTDINRLSQILRNLLSNAFKFTQVGGVILSIKRVDDAKLPIQISVKDSGMGIALEKRHLIFEAFAQADGSISRQYGGTGLGLSISLRFAKLLGGTIELNSIVGQGSEFSLLLPERAAEDLSANLAVQLPKPEKRHKNFLSVDDRDHLSPQDAVILLIDDDELFAEALLKINREQGYKTLLAMTGQEGLKLAQRYHPHGILLDLGLPDMNGSAVLHQLKSNPELATIPVYVVSGQEKDAALMQQGLLGYLQKPVDAQQISQAEAQLLHSIQDNPPAILVVEKGSITAEQVRKMMDMNEVCVLPVTAETDIEALLSDHACSLAIIDLGEAALPQTLQLAKRLRQINPQLNMVFVGQKSLTDDDEAQLRHYSDSIIIKAAHSEQRLLKNIERFLISKAPQNSQHEHPASLKQQRRLQGKHILLVDDDARNLFVITAALEKEGAKVDGVLSGKNALEFLQKQAVDLVFMDVMMPEMDGYQTLIALRNNPLIVKTPVVMLTAKSLVSDSEQALAAGADDYLTKPVDFDMLVNMAAVWCDHQHGVIGNG